MIRFKKYILMVLMVAVAIGASAQIPRTAKYLPSSEAASLGEFGEVPMSLYTGRAQVSIPIITLTDGGHSIPITLDYAGGGVKVEQLPGYVGTGWVLNGGGCITRQVRGLYPDEYEARRTDNMSNPKRDKYGYYYISKGLKQYQDWEDDNKMQTLIMKYAKQYADTLDFEPDRFTFSFPGCNGNFYLNENGEWIVQCEREVKVEMDWNNPDNFTMLYNRVSDYAKINDSDIPNYAKTKNIKGFTLIDDEGNRYVFGREENAIEFSLPLHNQLSESAVATSWYLVEIKYFDGKTARFRYSRKDDDFQLQLTDAQSYSYQNGAGATLGASYNGPSGSLIMPVYPVSYSFGGTTVNFSFMDRVSSGSIQSKPQYADILATNNGQGSAKYIYMPILKTAFYISGKKEEYDNAIAGLTPVRPLLRMLISGNQGGSCWVFDYSNDPKQRLTLNSVRVGPYLNEGDEYKYTFEYNNMAALPAFYSKQYDKWGYYNNYTADVNKPYNRPVTSHCAIYGSLSKIIYPTGGYNRFEYEVNSYSSQVDDNRSRLVTNPADSIGGGIRVKSIHSSPTGKSEDEYLYRSFKYNKSNNRSSGILLQPAKCHFRLDNCVDQYGRKHTIEQFSLHSVLTFDVNIQGAPVGYSQVEERFPDGCRRIHYYTNYDNGHRDRAPRHIVQSHSSYNPYTTLDQERGLEYLSEDYSASGKLTASRTVSFGNDRIGRRDSILVLSPSHMALLGSDNPHSYCGAGYTIHTHMLHPEVNKEDTYDINGVKSTVITRMRYGEMLLADTITTTGPGARSYRTIHYRPYSELPDNSDLWEASFQLCAVNRYNVPLMTVNQTIVDGKVYETSRTTLTYGNNNYVYPREIQESKGGGKPVPGVIYTYDDNNNVIVEEYPDGSCVGIIWARLSASDDRQVPVAVIEGPQVEHAVRTLTGSGLADSAMYSRLRNYQSHTSADGHLTTILVYDGAGRVEAIEAPTGNVNHYTYDCRGRVVTVGDRLERITTVFNYNYSR